MYDQEVGRGCRSLLHHPDEQDHGLQVMGQVLTAPVAVMYSRELARWRAGEQGPRVQLVVQHTISGSRQKANAIQYFSQYFMPLAPPTYPPPLPFPPPFPSIRIH